MTRIVAGIAGGRRLAVPRGQATRPTSDRAREGLFSTVDSMLGSLRGARVADLFAGSGAVGFEALSRGAAHVLFVERDPAAVRTVRSNAAALGLPGAHVVAAPVARVLATTPDAPYDVVFLDPPYAMTDDELRGLLAALRDNRWLAADAVVVIERPARGGEFNWPEGFAAARARRYGEATLWYGRPRTSVSPDRAQPQSES
jgi:16S rRNA (guanine966-N2)-methyltransferase